MSVTRASVRALGSLWFAAVILILWLIAMACATVVEATYGTERAQLEFYQAWWFHGLLGLLACNVLAALVVRYPIRKHQLGFWVTHTGILLTLGGALLTSRVGIDGRVALAEGETADYFIESKPTLTVTSADGNSAQLLLTSRAFKGLEPVTELSGPKLQLDDLQVQVARYLPDSNWVRHVTDDNRFRQPAVRVLLTAPDNGETNWIFTDQPVPFGRVGISYRASTDEREVQSWLNPPSADPESRGTIRIEHQDRVYELALEECVDEPVPLGDTGMAVRVLRYLPHAQINDQKKLVSVSENPVNPAVEIEFTGPEGAEQRLAFARFPEFDAMHGSKRTAEYKLTFVAPQHADPDTAVELIGGPGQQLYACFNVKGQDREIRPVEVNTPLETPWPGWSLTVLQRVERAQVNWLLEPVDPVRETRVPGLLLDAEQEGQTRQIWVQKHRHREAVLANQSYRFSFADLTLPLGFDLKLNEFVIRNYPGTGRPRSYESHVTLTDPDTGLAQDRVVSMNHPVQFAGYTLFQSSYNVGGGQRVSILSVSRDPGQIVAFSGYGVTTVGMIILMVTGLLARKHQSAAAEAKAASQADPDDAVDSENRTGDGTESTANPDREQASVRTGEIPASIRAPR